jgi:hypothetical protein
MHQLERLDGEFFGVSTVLNFGNSPGDSWTCLKEGDPCRRGMRANEDTVAVETGEPCPGDYARRFRCSVYMLLGL